MAATPTDEPLSYPAESDNKLPAPIKVVAEDESPQQSRSSFLPPPTRDPAMWPTTSITIRHHESVADQSADKDDESKDESKDEKVDGDCESQNTCCCQPESDLVVLKQNIEEVIHGFLVATGLLIAISSEKGCKPTHKTIRNIHNGGAAVAKVFSSLGYATIHIKNPSKTMFEALIQVLTKEIGFPESYKRLFLYYTGHGTENSIVTHDGYVPIEFLKTSLWPVRAPGLAHMPKVLILDCCRGSLDGNNILENETLEKFRQAFSDINLSGVSIGHHPCVGNVLIFYATHQHFRAFAKLNGVGMVTAELMRLFLRKESRSLHDVLQGDLFSAFRDMLSKEPDDVKAESSQVHPVVEGSLEEEIDLYKEKVRAMRPTNVHICDEEVSGMCTISWTPPLHAQHQHLQYYQLIKRRPGNNQTPLKTEIPDSSVTHIRLPVSEVTGFKLSVAAIYADSEEESDIFCYENVSLAPVDVYLEQRSEHLILSWRPSPHSKLFEMNGFKIFQCSKDSQEWVMLEPLLSSDARLHRLASWHAADLEYKIVAVFKDRESVGKLAEKLPGPGSRTTNRLYYCSLFWFILFLVLVAATYVAAMKPSQDFLRLAMAGDFINCDESFSWRQFYSELRITEVASDPLNDNVNGFVIDVLRVRKDKLKNHKLQNITYEPFDQTLTKGVNRFIMPLDYYMQPLYQWKNSAIDIQLDILNMTELPAHANLYLIRGEQDVNDFREHLEYPPHYEQRVNILDHLGSPIILTVSNNGYYFIGIDVGISYSHAVFVGNVTFNVIYLNRSDYQDAHFDPIYKIGGHLSFSLPGVETTVLCYIHPNTDRFASSSVHVRLSYLSPQLYIVVPAGGVLAIGALCTSTIICYVKKKWYPGCCCGCRTGYSVLHQSLDNLADST